MKGFKNVKAYLPNEGVVVTNIGFENGKIAYIGDDSNKIDEVIEVDGFGTTGASNGLYAALVSRKGVKLFDKQSQRSNNIFNPRGEYWNHFLKGWGWIGYADVAPACAFCLEVAEEEPAEPAEPAE